MYNIYDKLLRKAPLLSIWIGVGGEVKLETNNSAPTRGAFGESRIINLLFYTTELAQRATNKEFHIWLDAV
jgi:hypothetical protein